MHSGTSAFVYVAVRLGVTLGAGATLGWLAGSVWLGVSGAFGIYLAWNLWQLRALHFWLEHRSVADPPDAMGLWGDVVAQVVRLLLADDDLHVARRVAQVEEDHATVVAAAGHPAGEGDGGAGVGRAQRAGVVGAKH